MTVRTHLVAAVLIVSMGSFGTVLADFCQQYDGLYLGDVNGDAIIDMEDVRHTARHELGRANGSVPDPQAADIDLDGSITASDLRLLIEGAQRRQGVAFDLTEASYCFSYYGCPQPSPLPRARVEARLEGRVVSRTMTDSLGHAYLLLPPGTFDIVVYPPAALIDASLTATPVPAGLTTIQPPPYKGMFAPGDVLVKYDVAYGTERMLEIFAGQGVTSWAFIYPQSAWTAVRLPDCLHVMEVIEVWRTYPEILDAHPNYFTYLQ